MSISITLIKMELSLYNEFSQGWQPKGKIKKQKNVFFSVQLQ